MKPPKGGAGLEKVFVSYVGGTEEDDDARLCAVCLEGLRTNIMVPCGHVCLCARCAQQNWDECPICRTTTTMVMRAYF